MRIRKRKLWAAVLSAALLFNMTAVPAMADPIAYDESDANGDPVTIDDSGWTIDPDDDHKAKILLDENDDGDYLYSATMSDGSGSNWGNVTITGDDPEEDLTLFRTSSLLIDTASDQITLDVNCDDWGLDAQACIYFNMDLFTDDDPKNWNDDRWDQFYQSLDNNNTINVTEYENTYWERGLDSEEDGKWFLCYDFQSRDALKTVETGGWTITDRNVEGTLSSNVIGWENENNDYLCQGYVTSPVAGGRSVDTVITGTTDSRELNFIVYDKYEDYDRDNIRKLNDNDHILIDVTNPVNGRPDVTSVYLSAKYQFSSVSTVDDLLKIVEIKKNPGVEYEIYQEEDGDDDGDGMLWVIDFDGKSDQDKKEELAAADRKNDTATKTVRTQVFGDDIQMTGETNKKKTTYSITGLKKLTGVQKLTVNAEAKFTAEELKGLDLSKVTLSYNNADGTVKASDAKDEKARVKEVKKHLKINKKGVVQVKKDKNYASYVLTIPVDNCILHLTVVNIDFNKNALKKNVISAYSGDGSTVSVNLVEFVGKKAGNDSEFLSADWTVDNKIAVTTTDSTKPVQSKKKLKVWLSKDYRTLTISHPGDEKLKSGNVKVTALINGRKYNATVKVKINKKK